MTPRLYPLTFTPQFRDYLWGGRTLEQFGRQLPPGIVAESWEISGHPSSPTAVDAGAYRGRLLTDLVVELGRDLVGRRSQDALARGKFPLLVKLLDARQDLSVQVHPDDEYALAHEGGELGKTEMWYVLRAEPGARLIYGLRRGVTPGQVADALRRGEVEAVFAYLPVRAGDAIFVPAGTVHALMAGLVVVEIQQNSDTTYRIFDWGRRGPDGQPRALHIDKALDVIDFTHWLGALITSYEIIGTKHTPVRAVIDRAAALIDVPKLAFCFVAREGGVAGLFIDTPEAAWSQAADLSAQVHVHYVDRSYHQVLSVMPPLYDDLWTAAKGMYKLEPVVADGGEVIIYAPHIDEISYTHGRILDEIGYHVRDYFLKQWDRFQHYPWGVLAHSTHLRGMGTYVDGVERPRIQVTLATGIPRERCERVNLGYRDPATIDPAAWAGREDEGILLVPHAGEMLYRRRNEGRGEEIMLDSARNARSPR